LRLLKTRQEQSDALCPYCGKRLLTLRLQEPSLDLSGCRPCNIVWIDAQNYELIPEWTVGNNTGVSMQDIEAESLRRLKELKVREKAQAAEEKREKSLRRSLKTLWEREQ
jgi:Zn-finger nucleic acid-binding protein